MRETLAFYAGRYWDENEDEAAESVALLVLDPQKGALEKHAAVRGERNASYIQLHAGRSLMAIVSETGFDRGPHVSLYSFAGSLERPELLARHPTTGGFPCHVQFSSSGDRIVAANYEGALADAFEIDASMALDHLGSLDMPLIASRHERQGRPHGHFALFSGETVVLFDLGGNCLWIFPGTKPNDFCQARARQVRLAEGDGPRHGLMLDDNRLLLVNELSSSLVLLDLSKAEAGRELSRHTLGDGKKGNLPAAIRATRNGAHVYVSNRGADSVECFAVSKNEIERLAVFPVGPEPRDICLSDDEKYLLVACQSGHRIEVFERDETSGHLQATDIAAEMRSPVCIQAITP